MALLTIYLDHLEHDIIYSYGLWLQLTDENEAFLTQNKASFLSVINVPKKTGVHEGVEFEGIVEQSI